MIVQKVRLAASGGAVTRSKPQHKSKFVLLCRDLWAELHERQAPTQEWFDGWLSRIPNFGCSCRKDFAEYLKTNPPRFYDWYAWSIEAHNFVNKKLSKPIWPLDSSNAIA